MIGSSGTSFGEVTRLLSQIVALQIALFSLAQPI